MPDLGGNFKTFLKDSSSEDSDCKSRNQNDIDAAFENERTGLSKDLDLGGADVNEIFKCQTRSRSMLNRFAQVNNTVDSRVNPKVRHLHSAIKKKGKKIVESQSSQFSQQQFTTVKTQKKKVSRLVCLVVRNDTSYSEPRK